MIDPKQLERWKQVSEAASPGPWRANPYDRTVRPESAPSGFVVARQPHRATGSPVTHEQHEANLDLLAITREAVPALLAEVERLRTERNEASVLRWALRAVSATDDVTEARSIARAALAPGTAKEPGT
jgi:hypothetical protein